MANHPLQIAVVGAGRWGRHLIRNVCENPDCRLRAVCDVTLSEGIDSTGVTYLRDSGAVLRRKDVDAILIATPAETHAELVEAALESGRHVLCEKPLALKSAVCEHLDELARRRGLTLMVDCTAAYLEEVAEVGRQDFAGTLASIECVRTSQPPQRPTCGPLWDLAPHDLAILRSWFGRLS